MQGIAACLLARLLISLMEVATMACMPTDIAPAEWASTFEARLGWVSVPAAAVIGSVSGVVCAWHARPGARHLAIGLFAIAMLAHYASGRPDTVLFDGSSGDLGLDAASLVALLAMATLTCRLSSRPRGAPREPWR